MSRPVARSRLRGGALAALMVAIALCGTASCKRAGDLPPGAQTAVSSTAAVKPAPAGAPRAHADLALGPITTFAANCARCHGPEGAFYGDHYRQISTAQLREKVGQMMAGPAGLRPVAREIDAMAAYHDALRRGAPFLCITNAAAFATDGGPLRGEAPPDCVVTVVAPAGATLRRSGPRFEVHGVEAGAPLELVAQRGAETVRLRLEPGSTLWTEVP